MFFVITRSNADDKQRSRVGLAASPFARFTIKRDKSIFALLGLMTPSRALLSHVKPDTLNRDAMESLRREIGTKDESASRVASKTTLPWLTVGFAAIHVEVVLASCLSLLHSKGL